MPIVPRPMRPTSSVPRCACFIEWSSFGFELRDSGMRPAWMAAMTPPSMSRSAAGDEPGVEQERGGGGDLVGGADAAGGGFGIILW